MVIPTCRIHYTGEQKNIKKEHLNLMNFWVPVSRSDFVLPTVLLQYDIDYILRRGKLNITYKQITLIQLRKKII